MVAGHSWRRRPAKDRNAVGTILQKKKKGGHGRANKPLVTSKGEWEKDSSREESAEADILGRESSDPRTTGQGVRHFGKERNGGASCIGGGTERRDGSKKRDY